jgi:acyl-coenzyme A thioesterase PaaI-like protein
MIRATSMRARSRFRRSWQSIRKRLIFRLLNFWPPYLFAGIHVSKLDPAAGFAEVELRTHWWNRNYYGTAYGGSLFSMCDPLYALILIEQLGPRFIVWDKSASIRFRRPGVGTVRARFEIPQAEIDAIREAAIREGKAEPRFACDIIDAGGETVASVEKILHVKYVENRVG